MKDLLGDLLEKPKKLRQLLIKEASGEKTLVDIDVNTRVTSTMHTCLIAT